MVNTVAVEKLEDFIQKWAEKVIEEETTDQLEESKKDEVENGDGDTKEEDGKDNAGKEEENDAGKLGTRGVVIFVRFFVVVVFKDLCIGNLKANRNVITEFNSIA